MPSRSAESEGRGNPATPFWEVKLNTSYEMVNTVSGIRNYLEGADRVAFDIETAPDNEWRMDERASLDPHRAHIVGCSFSVKPFSGIYVPVRHLTGDNISEEEFLSFMREFLTSGKIIKICHNFVFESSFFHHLGITIQEPVYDTMAAAQMTLKSPTEFRNLHDSGLKTLARTVFKEDLPTFGDVTLGRLFDELSPADPETIRYGAADSDFAMRLYHRINEWFDAYMPRHRWLVENVESPVAVFLGVMKHNGIPVDRRRMEERGEEATAAMNRIREEISSIIGDVDIGRNCSTNAFKQHLFVNLGLPVLKTTETDREAADDMSMVLLKEWCDENRPELSPLFTLVQEYRKWGKILSTYITGYMKYINPVTGCIHPDLFSLSTDTGRMNCRNPNAQNMPRKTNDPIGVRSFIRAPEGHLIVSLDFSQIELRVGAFYCRDEVMMETYRTGGDIHAATTSVIFGCTYEEAKDKHRDGYKEQRTIAKNCNFGVFFGLFPKGLQRTLKFRAGVEKTEAECEQIITNLKSGYPRLASWQEEAKAEAAVRMYTQTWLGRRRYLPDIKSANWGRKSFAERCALNTPIQGTAADMLKLAITRILSGLPERPWLKPILQIHDELVFVIPEERLDEAVSFIRRCMEEKPFPEFDLPLVAEASYGPDFGAMEEME